MNCRLEVNGFEVRARFSRRAVEEIYLPLLRELTARQARMDRRLIAFLAAPPAAGKSTLAAFLQQLSRRTPGVTPLQALGMDGFHYPQAYLEAHELRRDGESVPLKSIKGAPETFDIGGLARALDRVRAEDIRWPAYDRRLHDVVPEALKVTERILLVEGNWLLLDEPRWRELRCDYSVFIGAEEELLTGRLIDRKVRGGLSAAAAEAWVESSDGPNVRRCMARRRPADLSLMIDTSGELRRCP